tara:strand:- start:27 stop:137 length:111 start_codon:yes stop_codon:yes gene_type:complete
VVEVEVVKVIQVVIQVVGEDQVVEVVIVDQLEVQEQ